MSGTAKTSEQADWLQSMPSNREWRASQVLRHGKVFDRKRLGPPRVGVAEHVGFVHHHHRVVIGTIAEVSAPASQLPAVEKLLERDILQVKPLLVAKLFPHSVAQCGARDQEHPLPPVLHGLPNQLAGNERLTQAHTIGEEHAAELIRVLQTPWAERYNGDDDWGISLSRFRFGIGP